MIIGDKDGEEASARLHCPFCRSTELDLLGAVEADQAILGEDEYVYRCLGCNREWVLAKDRSRYEALTKDEACARCGADMAMVLDHCPYDDRSQWCLRTKLGLPPRPRG